MVPVTAEAGSELLPFTIGDRLTPHVRHRQKYVDVPVTDNRAFVFLAGDVYGNGRGQDEGQCGARRPSQVTLAARDGFRAVGEVISKFDDRHSLRRIHLPISGPNPGAHGLLFRFGKAAGRGQHGGADKPGAVDPCGQVGCQGVGHVVFLAQALSISAGGPDAEGGNGPGPPVRTRHSNPIRGRMRIIGRTA